MFSRNKYSLVAVRALVLTTELAIVGTTHCEKQGQSNSCEEEDEKLYCHINLFESYIYKKLTKRSRTG